MFEISNHIDLKAKSREQMESTDVEFTEISFEELLAQEKKDSFWFVTNIQPSIFPKSTKSIFIGLNFQLQNHMQAEK